MSRKLLPYLFLYPIMTVFLLSCTKEERPPDPVIDIDGNSYKTVKIGTQIFMAENLRTTRFNDGSYIPKVESSKEWRSLMSPGYCWYNEDNEENKTVYGALYNAYTIDSSKLCPTGWHVPSNEEWNQLRDFLGDTLKTGGKLKLKGTDFWHAPNKGADNSTVFSAPGSGIRYNDGSFTARNYYVAFWSSTPSGVFSEWFLSLYYGDTAVKTGNISKKTGLSVRCIKDLK
jgi:uncharacterized protein (TIGR02145 family)